MLFAPDGSVVVHFGGFRKEGSEAEANAILVHDVVNNHTALVEALKPFADFADKHKNIDPSWAITLGSSRVTRQLTIGDCYKASTVLTQITNAMEVGK